MRTTLTLEPDVAKQLKEYARLTRSTFKDAVNQLLRSGLSGRSRGEVLAPFVVVPHPPSGFRAGIDPMRLQDFLDDEDARFARAAGAEARTTSFGAFAPSTPPPIGTVAALGGCAFLLHDLGPDLRGGVLSI